MDNLDWNVRNLFLADLVMVGIFRLLWIALLEMNQGASRMDRSSSGAQVSKPAQEWVWEHN